jgi:hypothetical protein
MAATSVRNALEFMLDKRCVTPKNNGKSLYTSREQLRDRSLGDRKATQADKRCGHVRTSTPQATPLVGRKDDGYRSGRFSDWNSI